MSWPVFCLSLLLLILGAGAAWYVNHLYQGLSRILDLNVASVRAAEELEIGLREIRTSLNEYTYGYADVETLDFPRLFEGTDRWVAEVERLATTAHEQEIIEKLHHGYDHFLQQMNHLLNDENDDDRQQQLRLMIDEILTREIIEPAHAYLDYNENTMQVVAEEHKIFSKRIANALLLIAICGSIGGFGAGVLVARRMTRSLIELKLPLSLAAGKLSEIVGPIRVSTGLDLNELKRILDVIAVEVEGVVLRLQRSQQEILHSEKLVAIGKLAAGAAHEIRNPLMSIKLLIQSALLGEGGFALQTADLKMMEQEISRLERTVQQLLEFARQPPISIGTITPALLIDQSIRLLQGRAKIQNVRLLAHVDNARTSFKGDHQQLTQVILNILINSLDASEPGGAIHVTAEEEVLTGLQRRIRFVIDDEGRGIPEDLLPHIFDPFVSNKEAGTGLGLSVSKQIVEAHQGEIFASNRESRGTRVGFSIPLAE